VVGGEAGWLRGLAWMGQDRRPGWRQLQSSMQRLWSYTGTEWSPAHGRACGCWSHEEDQLDHDTASKIYYLRRCSPGIHVAVGGDRL
jgi:hypothetical protein